VQLQNKITDAVLFQTTFDYSNAADFLTRTKTVRLRPSIRQMIFVIVCDFPCRAVHRSHADTALGCQNPGLLAGIGVDDLETVNRLDDLIQRRWIRNAIAIPELSESSPVRRRIKAWDVSRSPSGQIPWV